MIYLGIGFLLLAALVIRILYSAFRPLTEKERIRLAEAEVQDWIAHANKPTQRQIDDVRADIFESFEIKIRKIHFISNLFAKGDQGIHAYTDLVVFKYNRYKKITNIFIFEFLPSYLYELLVRMKDHVSKKYYSAGDGFRGRRVLRSNGSVSFFLERLSEDK